MRYLLLIHSDHSLYATFSEERFGKLMGAYEEFSAALKQAGAFVASDRLQPPTTATTVRVRDGEMLTTDGPFAETKEQFGGYYDIDVKDLDEATQWAAKIPTAEYGCVEVRPIWVD